MKLLKILEHFEGRTRVPISVEEVRAQVEVLSPVDRVRFVRVHADEGLYHGHFERYRYRPAPYEQEIECCDIHYADSLSDAQTRLTVVKELLHLLDIEPWRIHTEAEVRHLIGRIVLSPDLQSIEWAAADGPKVVWDRLNGVVAAAVLFPFAARSLVEPKYQEGTLGLEEISALLQLPVDYAQLILSEGWPRLYEAMKGLARA